MRQEANRIWGQGGVGGGGLLPLICGDKSMWGGGGGLLIWKSYCPSGRKYDLISTLLISPISAGYNEPLFPE
jgi:hypothetical protein